MSENQKKVWITGASSGIGKATAEKFAKENWKVAISARREELLNEMAKDQNIFAFPMDVTDQNKTEETFNKIIKEFGDLDLCIFSSGTYERKSEKGLSLNSPLSLRSFISSKILLASCEQTSKINLSKLLATWISMLGETVCSALEGL